MTDSAPDTHGLQDQPDPPVTAAPVLPWRDATMDDAPAYLDADTASGWAMGYNAAREAFLNNRGALFDLAMSNLPADVPAEFIYEDEL